MTLWLKKRLVLWVGGVLALGVIGFRVAVASEAQFRVESDATPPATISEATQLFVRLLQVNKEQRNDDIWINEKTHSPDSYLESRLISLHDWQSLGKPAIDVLLDDLANLQTPVFHQSVPRQEKGKTVVDITPDANFMSATPIVLVKEESGYRVDLINTYAKRLKLGTGTLETVIYKKTDIALAGLPYRDTPRMRRDICQSRMNEVVYALGQYVQDYDEIQPPARQWHDALVPYTRSDEVFTCPSLPKNQQYGYAFNAKLSGKSLLYFSDPRRTVAVYETTLLKRNAYGLGEAPAFRHENGAIYGFANGSAKWFAKNQVPSFKLKP